MTPDTILSLARNEIGTKETGLNNVKYNTDYYDNPVNGAGYHWCCVFVWWIFKKAGASSLFYDGGKVARVTEAQRWFESKGAFTKDLSSAQPGDVIFFDWDPTAGNGSDHIGFVDHVNPDGTIITIEGNTTNPNESGQAEGVYARTRKNYISGIGRPAYEGAATLQPYDPTTPISDSPGTGDTIDTPISTADIPYNPSFIENRRLAALADQPLHAYVKIKLGDNILATESNRPNIIQSFEITRIQGAGEEVTFTLFADDDLLFIDGGVEKDIETLLIDYRMNVIIEYGYVDSVLVSKEFRVMLTKYDISFNTTGVILTVEALSVGAASINLKQLTLPQLGKNPREAILAICEAAGIPTREEYISTDILTITDTMPEFHMFEELPVAYIYLEILPLIKDSEGNDFSFYIDNEGYAHLESVGFNPTLSSDETIRTYIYQKGYDSVVQSMTFNINGVYGGGTAYTTASGLRGNSIDPITKQEYTVEETIAGNTNIATGAYQSISADQSIPYVDPAGYTEEQLSYRLSYHMNMISTRHYQADMTLIGDPTIELLSDIRIINVTDRGYLHPTSGIYKIMGIIDRVENGMMTTDLHIVRNGNINNGVELLHSRYIIK